MLYFYLESGKINAAHYVSPSASLPCRTYPTRQPDNGKRRATSQWSPGVFFSVQLDFYCRES